MNRQVLVAPKLLPWLALAALLLLSLPLEAWAQAAAPAQQFAFAQDSYFINVILKGILGNVINPSAANAPGVITGQGTLGEVFRTFNTGIAFFGSVIVVFITVVGVLQSGNDGEFLGKRWSSMWVPLRFATGSALMLPMTSSGYAFCQAMVLWVAGQGVGLADTLWSTIVSKIIVKDGVELTAAMDLSSVAKQVALSEICMAGVNAVRANSGSSEPPLQLILSPRPVAEAPRFSFQWGAPGQFSSTAGNTTCGRVEYAVGENNRLSDPYQVVRVQSAAVHFDQIAALAQKYRPIAEDIVRRFMADSQLAGSDPTPRLIELGSNVYNADTVSYNTAVSTAVTTALRDSGYKVNQQGSANADMARYGFAMAGMWYIELLKVHNTARHSLNAPSTAAPNLQALAAEPSMENFSIWYRLASEAIGSANGNTTSSATSTAAATAPGPAAAAQSGVRTTTTNFVIDTDSLIKTGSLDGVFSSAANWLREFLFGVGPTNGSANAVWRIGSNPSTDPNVSTILQLKNKGDVILNAAGIIVAADMLSRATVSLNEAAEKSGIVGKALSGMSSFLGLVTAVGNAAAYVMTGLGGYVATLAGMLFMLGVTLSVIIPMLPYVIWVGALIGMVILIMEVLVAIMLWSVMLMHPAGEGITSQYNAQGLHMLLAVFARPALLLLGLTIGMFIVEPMVTFVNDTFSIIIQSVQSSTMTGLFSTVAFIAIYVSLILLIVERSFAFIYVLADRALTVIGGPGALTGEENRIQQQGRQMTTAAAGATKGLMVGRAVENLRRRPSGRMAAPGMA